MELSSTLNTALNPVYDTLGMAGTVLTVVAVLLIAVIVGVVIFIVKMSKKK